MNKREEREEEKRVKAILEKLSPEARAKLEENPEIADIELKNRKQYFPSKDWVPNIAQERALEWARKRHEKTGDFCKENLFLAGNGVGKTCTIPNLLAGATLGNEALNPDYFADHDFFKFCDEIRRERPIRIRLVCDGADMEENGSLCQQIKKFLPIATMGAKLGGKYYSEVRIPASSRNHYATMIDVKTFGMPLTAHAGPDYDLVIFNEPPPKDVYIENASRIRSGGYLCAYLTPLSLAGYLLDLVNGQHPEGTLSKTGGSIWDNCKDVPGTRGVLTRDNIEDQIRRWRNLDPLQLDARIYGKFMQLAGAIFQIFDTNIHVIPPMQIQDNWNVYMCIDHHSQKPACMVWMAHDCMGMWYVIAEYPIEQWDQLLQTTMTIKDFCIDAQKIETGKNYQFPYIKKLYVLDRFGDPNSFRWRDANTNQSIKQQYEERSGWDFNLNVDNDIELRHDKIKELLQWDPMRKRDSINCPHLFVFNSCKNTQKALLNYAWANMQADSGGLSGKIDQKWKDWIDDIGYIVTSAGPYRENKGGTVILDDEYDEVLDSRNPDRQDFDRSKLEDPAYSGERWL